jgi:hypothetical protein
LAPVGALASIFQTASPYTDPAGDSVGSSNALRDIVSATITNDATNLYITLEMNPTATINNSDGVSGAPNNTTANESAANIATGGSFDYIMGITKGSGGDTSANGTTHGNAYGRAISIDSSLGGMTDMIGMFGVGGSGTTASPYTNYGFNDYVWSGTSWGTSVRNDNTAALANAQGDSMSATGGDSSDNTFTVVVPMADLSNLPTTAGSTFEFDIYSTGTSGNQTAYDSLADQSETQSGTYSATAQYNSLVVDSYTIQAVPEPAVLGLCSIASLLLLKRRARS